MLVALAWYGSLAMIDRSASSGLDLIAGLGTVAALDRLLARGRAGRSALWAALAFLAAGWPPLAVLALATVVLGRSAATWSWSMTFRSWRRWRAGRPGRSPSPAEAWAAALALPITQSSAWGLAFTAVGLGLPWAPFAVLAANQTLREGWSKDGRRMVLGWLKVVGASLIVGMMVPGLGSAALVPALAGLAFVAAGCWDRLLDDPDELPGAVGKRARRIALAIAGLWLVVVLAWGGHVGFAVAYYRSTVIILGVISLVGFLLAIRSSRLGEARWAFGGMVAVSIAIKLAHWGYYAPESNYRTGAGPLGPGHRPVGAGEAPDLRPALVAGRPLLRHRPPGPPTADAVAHRLPARRGVEVRPARRTRNMPSTWAGSKGGPS